MLRRVPRGALTEISGAPGSGKTELILRFLAAHPGSRIAWIEDHFTVYPRAFPQLGVRLDRVLFAEAGKEAAWAAHQMLRSGLFEFVLLSARGMGELELRRLQLSAEKAAASLVLLSEKPVNAGGWALSLQIQVSRAEGMRILKERHRTEQRCTATG